MENVDVLLVGGGPAGLTAAGDLARAGRSVAVLERWPQRHPASRAFATMARTVELFDSRCQGGRSLAERLLERAATTPRVDLWPGASVRLAELDTPFPFGVIAPQTVVDGLLEDYAREHGARIERGTEVVGLVQDGDGVTVTARTTDGGVRSTWRASYLVAADGAHSTVRGLLGVEFPGRSVLSSVVLADVRLAHPPEGTALTLGSTPDGFAFLAPYGDGWYRSMTWDRNRQLPDDAPVADSDVRDVLDHAMGRDTGLLEIGWRSRFHCDERQVAEYRHGRVFLTGDAAHVHSPMGGQGMNTGIQDAVNLAWKIDAALAAAGIADAVLDTYQAERHPIGRRVVFQSGAMMRGVTLHPRPARAVRSVVGSWLLGTRSFGGLVAGSFSGVGLRYRRRRGEHPLVGTRAVGVPLAEGTVLHRQRRPGFLFVRQRGADPVALPPDRQAERTDDGPAVLVRPDGYVGWAGRSGDTASWSGALARWTGHPAPAPVAGPGQQA